jgi:hypothetical protein
MDGSQEVRTVATAHLKTADFSRTISTSAFMADYPEGTYVHNGDSGESYWVGSNGKLRVEQPSIGSSHKGRKWTPVVLSLFSGAALIGLLLFKRWRNAARWNGE